MGSVFHDLYDMLKRNEKEMLISRSGSTTDSRCEKIRSGQSYLYKRCGMESEVLEIRFRSRVFGAQLNQALLIAIKRYPYFNTRLVEKDGDFYIVQNEQGLTAKRTKKLARLGHISCGYHLIDVTYFDDSVYISFHHALCDGRGIMPFVETLVYYYCVQRYGSTPAPEGIRLAGEPLLPGETVDPFLKEYDFDQSKELIGFSRDAFAIPEIGLPKQSLNYRYELQIPASRFMQVCKEFHATPAILLALLMNRGIANMYPDYDRPIHANIAADMRDALDAPNTFKNCVRSMILPYDRELAAKSLCEQASEYRRLLSAQRDRDFCRKEANAMIGLFDRLDHLDSYQEKQKIMTFFEGMTLNTYIISYLGRMKLGENAAHIDGMHLYNSGTTGLGINMIACGESFCLDFKQSFPSDKYVKAFREELETLGIGYQASGQIPFITPCDSIIKRNEAG